jgi:GNAT superfamily N-acetyltransferase
MSAVDPSDPWDSDSLAHDWEFEDRDEYVRRWILEAGGSRVGIADVNHYLWERTDERYVRVNAYLWPGKGSPEQLGAAFDEVEERGRAEQAQVLQAFSHASDRGRISFLEARAYEQDRHERQWELDLVANRGRILELAQRARDRMREQAVSLITLDRWDPPDALDQLYRLDMAATSDIPSTETFVPHDFENWQLWFKKPALHRDRFWLAIAGGRVIGLSVLLYPKHGHVNTDFTGVAREARGRGIARALKLETLAQAIELGVKAVRTFNDGENAPILHLNEEFGYRELPGWLQLAKPA